METGKDRPPDGSWEYRTFWRYCQLKSQMPPIPKLGLLSSFWLFASAPNEEKDCYPVPKASERWNTPLPGATSSTHILSPTQLILLVPHSRLGATGCCAEASRKAIQE